MRLDKKTKIAYWLALNDIKGVGPSFIKQLYDQYASMENILNNTNVNALNSKLWSRLNEYLINVNLNFYLNMIEKTYDIGAKIYTLEDSEYPENLRRSSTAPAVLFFKGSLSKLSPRALALVGRVDPTPEGLLRAKKFALHCAKNNIQIISGLARGIDTASHRAALDFSGLTYAIVAHGIDHCYPPENKELYEEITKNGAVISQFPTGTKPNRWMFPARNETMCTISSGTVIIEATSKCGSLIQAKHSFRHGRRVFLLHSNLKTNEDWAYKLVEKGALVVKEFEVVLKEMGEIHQQFKLTTNSPQQPTLFTFADNNRAILFDLDGVLFDAKTVLEATYLKVFAKMGQSIDINLLRSKINNAPPYVFKTFKCDSQVGNQLFKKAYFEVIGENAPFFNGIKEAIAILKEKKYKLGIVTSQPLSRYKAIISKAEFKDSIDTAVTWNDLTRDKQKPKPDGILKALNMLEVKPENAAYIGDGEKDILAAKNAGVYSIAVSWGLEDKEKLLKLAPDKMLHNPSEIAKINL